MRARLERFGEHPGMPEERNVKGHVADLMDLTELRRPARVFDYTVRSPLTRNVELKLVRRS